MSRLVATEGQHDFDAPPSLRFVAEVLLPQLQQESSKADWRQQTQALLNLRRVAKFHVQLLTPVGFKAGGWGGVGWEEEEEETMRRLCSAVLALLNSPRSSLAKNAAITLSDLFAFGRGRTDAAVAEVIDVCLKKSCQSVEFLAEAARAVLHSVCCFASEGRTFSAFCTATANAKHQGARCVGVSCLAFLIDKYRRRPPDLMPLLELLLQVGEEGRGDRISGDKRGEGGISEGELRLRLLGVQLRTPVGVTDASDWRGIAPEQLKARRTGEAPQARHLVFDEKIIEISEREASKRALQKM
ncbi:hypothetical protein cyc_06579 [Cyclospora cayetanensis]|uniref:TOG domain-containing protein n=1 Tax=Cyclospora cayetanensis TaxID=88456 RepID=A0A1D3CR08_9EIME|nr:hypothetical protein cyc_06579 [Cyclospora cayetanensis]